MTATLRPTDAVSPPTAEALLRLDRPGPRYTSYPTAAVWRSDLPDAVWHDALRAVNRPASVYVHIPFCAEQCLFCGCNMVVGTQRPLGDRYLDALERQVSALPLAVDTLPVARIHFGGGTPTWLDEAQTARLYALLYRRFTPIAGAEISVEVDPEVTNDAQLDQLAALGVTRVSLGVQSFDPTVLAAVNRPQDTRRVHAVAARARHHGMRGLNLDLIYGLPHQTLASLASTLDEVLALSPDRLALYSFAHVPWLKPHQRRIPAESLPGPAAKLEMMLYALDRLEDAGFQAIGMDHFAKADDELAVAQRERRLHRNFMGYTTRGDLPLIGLGMSAISELDGVYVQQHAHLGTWWKAVEGGGGLVEKGWVSSPEDRLRADAISELMCNFDLDLAALGARHGRDAAAHFAPELAALASAADEGLCTVSPRGVAVTRLGRLLVRNVAMVFDQYLGGAGQRYSRTI